MTSNVTPTTAGCLPVPGHHKRRPQVPRAPRSPPAISTLAGPEWSMRCPERRALHRVWIAGSIASRPCRSGCSGLAKRPRQGSSHQRPRETAAASGSGWTPSVTLESHHSPKWSARQNAPPALPATSRGQSSQTAHRPRSQLSFFCGVSFTITVTAP